ncbi:hypothetical protein NJB14192_00430 [Mycobacterium montefiorense]|nr:hypothetical protein NJB14192_00430 [Mycobacterium montefiorense]
MKYVFAPGRDVIVAYGDWCDIPLDRLGFAAPPPPIPQPDLLLRFAGTRWVAVDRSRTGIFVDGVRVPTLDIRDGQTIALGDPQRGPRLVFRIGPPQHAPYAPPPPKQPPRPPAPPPMPPPAPAQVPTERGTQRMRIAPSRQPTAERPIPPMAPPPVGPPPTPPAPFESPPPAEQGDEQPKSRGLIERVTDATRKLRASRPSVRTEEPNTTYRLPLKAAARTVGVDAYRLGLTADGRELLRDISFTARPGTLTAVAGPSAARNSTLLGVLAGTKGPSTGLVAVDSHDVYAEPESMRTRIGIVPREDRIHRRLTVEQALSYTAELRLPPDTSGEHRQRVVDQVLEELELTAHRKTRIGKLSPELSRCASVAIELITRPTLLVVDEPSAGLDATQEAHVMSVLRRQADLGCVVVLATTSLTHLDMCDQVLLLTPAGTMAFAGAPQQIESAMGTAHWAEVLARINADPDGAHRTFSARQQAQGPPEPSELSEPWPPPLTLTMTRQGWLVARRQVRLLVADPVYALFLIALPFALAALTLLIPGDSGLARPGARSHNPHEAVEILAALNITAVILGTALTVRELVGERRVFRREQAVGLSTSAYLAAKILVFSVAAAILAAIAFTIVIADMGRPVHGAVLLENATAELYMSVALTAIVSAIVGLALSTVGKSLRNVVPLVVPVILASLLFAGGLITLVGTWGYDQISWFIPAQWGFAASASTVDLHRVDTQATEILTWTHYAGWWMFDMTVLAVFGAAWAGFVRFRLRPPIREIRKRPLHREQQEGSDLPR